jgi:3-oxoacyl-[acyl-carrier protein] reductase
MTKTVVIVGASRGIGKALVQQFAKDENQHVLALARNSEKMEKAFALLDNVSCKYYDLCSPTARADMENILAEYENISILVNNAGYLVNKPFLELNRDDLVNSYTANAIGVLQTVQAAIPKMLNTGGHVVSISTMGAFLGSAKFPGLAAYSSSKTGVLTMTELLAEEFKAANIKFNCLCLGAVQTEMLEEAFPGYQAPLSAEEMAKFIHDFASNAHQFLNGKVIPVSLSTP